MRLYVNPLHPNPTSCPPFFLHSLSSSPLLTPPPLPHLPPAFYDQSKSLCRIQKIQSVESCVIADLMKAELALQVRAPCYSLAFDYLCLSTLCSHHPNHVRQCCYGIQRPLQSSCASLRAHCSARWRQGMRGEGKRWGYEVRGWEYEGYEVRA